MQDDKYWLERAKTRLERVDWGQGQGQVNPPTRPPRKPFPCLLVLLEHRTCIR